MTMNRSLAAGILIVASAAAAHADSVTLPALRDTSLFEDALGERSSGAGVYLFTGQTLGMGERRALLRFNLASLPSGSTITGVELRANVSRFVATSAAINLHRLTADWGEGASDSGTPGGGGAPALPGDASWSYRFFDTELWSTPGGGGDFRFDPSGSAAITTTGPVAWLSNDDLKADVQAWLDQPGDSFGWILITPGDEGNAARIDSREHPDPLVRPKLIVTFTPPPPPCPADFNQSGAITVQDIFDFLAAYFMGLPAADFNNAGGITVQDIFDFLAAYFTGCP